MKMTVVPIEQMYTQMAANKDSQPHNRVRYIAETTSIIEDRLYNRSIVDVRDTVSSWLSIAADVDENEAVRIAVLCTGVTPVIALLAQATKHHRDDTKAHLADNFAGRALDSISKLQAVLPPPQATMDALLSIAEGEGQASTQVRLAAHLGYMSARQNFCYITGYVENDEQAARNAKIASDFPHAGAMHARVQPRFQGE